MAFDALPAGHVMCLACEKPVRPVRQLGGGTDQHGNTVDMRFRDVCPQCQTPCQVAAAPAPPLVAPPAKAATVPEAAKPTPKPSEFTADGWLESAKARLAVIDAELDRMSALREERTKLERLIRAMEREPKPRRERRK